MEKHLFGFLFFVREGLSHIKEILREGKIEIGKEGALMLTSVHHWLKMEKPLDALFSTPSVPEWGLGFRLSALEKMGLRLQWYKYDNNDNLVLTKIPPHLPLSLTSLIGKAMWWFFAHRKKRGNGILRWQIDINQETAVSQSGIG